MNAATVARVQDAVAKLGYRPNQVASSMITGRTWTIGLLVPDISNPFFGHLAAAIEQTAGGRGFAVLIASSELDPELEASHVEALVARQVDGLIYAGGSSRPNPTILKQTLEMPPIVFIDEAFDWIPDGVGTVSVDNEQGGRIAAEHLFDLGHRTVLAITGPVGLPTAHSRTSSFHDAFLEAHGWTDTTQFVTELADIVRVDIVHADSYTIDDGYQVAKAALGDRKAGKAEVPTALYCANDLLACGALRAVKELGLRVPADVSVISFDNTLVCELTNPTLTSISQPLAAMGREAANTVIALIDNDGCPDPAVQSESTHNSGTVSHARDLSDSITEQQWTARLPVSLIVRESTTSAFGTSNNANK